MSEIITKVGKKGVIVIPKKIRDILRIKEGSLVAINIKDDMIIISPFTPKRVKLGGKVSKILEEMRGEEYKLET